MSHHPEEALTRTRTTPRNPNSMVISVRYKECGATHDETVPVTFEAVEFGAACSGSCRSKIWDKIKQEVRSGEYLRTTHIRTT